MLLSTALDGRQRRFAQTIQRSAASLLEIINGVLDFSKIEAGKVVLENTVFDLGQLVEDVTELCAEGAHSKGLDLTCVLPPELPSAVCGDPVRLRQILTNLVGNAVKFTDQGEIVVRIEPEEELGEGATVGLRFEIRDTGIGIPLEVQSCIFEAFRQADGSTTRKFGGTGLGLAIAHQLVSLMGGELAVESSPGAGSAFRFTLRLERGGGPRPAVGLLDGLRVLLLMNSATARDNLERHLLVWNAEPAGVSTHAQAMSYLAQAAERGRPFDVVILEHESSAQRGSDTALAILSDPLLANPEIVVLAPLGDRTVLDAWTKAGFPWHITKPIRRTCAYETLGAAAGRETSAGARHDDHVATGSERLALSGQVLLAEDNPVNQEVLHSMLEMLGCSVLIAQNGREALAVVEAEPVDLVLMDCQMPEMDGFEATAAIREHGRGQRRYLPIIALTANAVAGDRERCLAAGMDEYLSKPIDHRRLCEMLKRWLHTDLPLRSRPSSNVSGT